MKLEIVVAALSVLAVGVLGGVAFGEDRLDARPLKQASEDRTPAEAGLDLVVEELETLPEDVTVQLTEDTYPEVYEFFRTRIAAQEEAARSPSEAAGCCTGDSLRIVPVAGGVLGILDQGDGVIRILAFVVDPDNPDLGNRNGLALSAIITEEGVELLWMDMDRLVRFVGGIHSGAIVSEGADDRVKEGSASSESPAVALDCYWANQQVCCAVATEDRFCVCCASLSPINVGCGCTQLK